MIHSARAPKTLMSFETLGLSDKVLSAVKAAGYTTPTPIQAQAIPHVLERRDVLGLAQTGTGKTAGFVLPMLTLLEKGRARARMPRTLILEPTRELASQVQDHFGRYGVNHKLNLALLIGGVSFDEQDKIITRGADVLIATPGRLLDHFERGRLLLTGVDILVIDEADRMLDMGFIPDIERIVKLLPFTRQTLFFSATMPPEITQLVDKFLHNPVRVEVSKPASVVETITHRLVSSASTPHDKRATLRGLIDNATDLTNAIIFCNRKRDVATLHRSLERHGYSVGALHGDMDQHARLATLDSFRDNKITLLVASDVAARGLDIPAVSHIFNFDVPTHSEDYVHRIGRTGRAGRAGAAFTIVTRSESKYIASIEKLIGKPIEWAAKPDTHEQAPSDSAPEREERAPRDRSRSRRGGRSRGEHRGREGGERHREAPHHEKSAARSEAPRHERSAARSEAPIRQDAESRQEVDRKPRRKEHDAEESTTAVGFSDHVPAFLLRPVRIREDAETLEEAQA